MKPLMTACNVFLMLKLLLGNSSAEPMQLPKQMIDEKGEVWNLADPEKKNYVWEKDKGLTGRLVRETFYLEVGQGEYLMRPLLSEQPPRKKPGLDIPAENIPGRLLDSDEEYWNLLDRELLEYAWAKDQNYRATLNFDDRTLSTGKDSYPVRFIFLEQPPEKVDVELDDRLAQIHLPKKLIDYDGQIWNLKDPNKAQYTWEKDSSFIGSYNLSGIIIAANVVFSVSPYEAEAKEGNDNSGPSLETVVTLQLPDRVVDEESEIWVLKNSRKREYFWEIDPNLIGKYDPISQTMAFSSATIAVTPRLPEKK